MIKILRHEKINEYTNSILCGCCNECTNDSVCQCDCEDCICNNKHNESINWHIDNQIPFSENIYRVGSESFFEIIYEARKIFTRKPENFSEVDKYLFNSTDFGKYGLYEGVKVPLDLPMENDTMINEAKYKGKEVKLNKPMRSSGPKKYKVYVRDPKTGNVKVVNFGDAKGGLKVKISDPEARRNFAARHDCKNKKDKTKPGYWACRVNKYGYLFGGKTYPGFW